jgi:uncharacterized protein YjiS (DUF1127 family)
MSYQRQKLRQIEDQLSPVITPVVLDHGDIQDALKRARYMRSQQAAVFTAAAKRALGTIVAKIVAWNARQRAAQQLRQLDGHLLADIGLSRGDIGGAVFRGQATDNVDMQANAIFVPEASQAAIPARHKYAA